MKTKILILLLVSIQGLAFSQSSPVDKLFDKYSGKEGFTTVYISHYMFDMFRNVNTDDKDFDGLIKGLNSIRILTIEDPKLVPAGLNFYKEIINEIPANQYKELMVIKEKGQDVKFLVKEEQGRIVELLLISGGNDNAFISIEGNIDMKSLSRLSKSLNIQSLKPLENVDKEANKK